MNTTMPATDEMSVIKRDGGREPVSFDKVLERIRRAATGLSVNYTRLAQLTLAEIHDGVRTTELDELAARIAISFMTTHPDWGTLAARIIVSNCQASAPATFSAAMEELAALTDTRNAPAPALHADVIAFIRANADALNAMVQPANDFLLDYFGFKTLEKAYLMRGRGRRVVETPQYMWLRVAVGIHYSFPDDTLDRIRETYELMSTKAFTHATPTLFNAGTPRPQLSSCFLMGIEDSLDGIFDTLKQCAQISKYAGGIGIHMHNIRAQGSLIRGTNGQADGLTPLLRVFNNTARYVNQSGRRNGSFAIYLEPWHADIQAFLKMKSNTGSEEERARDLFYALWIPDLFMKRVEAGGDWSLFCPNEAPGLADVTGADFEALYTRYEAEGLARKTIPAQRLWSDILVSQIETGTPYLLYKDAANAKSNQKNLGVIKSSNLCVAPETLLLTDSGTFPIATLKDEKVNVWNGKQYAPVTVHQTGTAQPLITVVVKDECARIVRDEDGNRDVERWDEIRELTCTPYHKFILRSPTSISSAPRIEAQELKPGMDLYDWYDGDMDVNHHPVVIAVHDMGRRDDTYCFNEPINHAGVFNGILTGQCSEIIEYSDSSESAVCNLASIALPHFVEHVCKCIPTADGLPQHSISCPLYNPDFHHGTDPEKPLVKYIFNFARLREVTQIVVRNLNRVIDINYYPTPETRRSNMRHRPIGLGVQGLADVFALMGLAWETPEAAHLNQEIFENIYYAALTQSHAQALTDGPYETFRGSPASNGLLQQDLWSTEPSAELLRRGDGVDPSASAKHLGPLCHTAGYLDWDALRVKVQRDGLRNSLLLAVMPTASTSQVLGYNECCEPITTNIYTRRTLAGEFILVNKYLVADLMAAGLWGSELKDRIVAANGSIQGIAEIPEAIKARYKTVWEIKQKTLIDMSADRGAYICQSQSLNLFVQDPTIAKLSSMHFYAWRRGLKTGIYYLRTKSAVQAIKFTVDPSLAKAAAASAATGEDKECLLCSS